MIPEMNGRKKRVASSEYADCIRNFACWSQKQEERWLEKRAARGWQLYAVVGACLYRFRKITPQPAMRYAVEYIDGEADVPEQLAEICNSGWDYLGKFGKKRYFCTTADQPLVHPACGRPVEERCLRTVQSNLTTAGLLNIPGTLYCLLYVFLFLGEGGFYVSELFESSTGGWVYLLGLLLGAVSIAYVLRGIFRLRSRLKSLEMEEPARVD